MTGRSRPPWPYRGRDSLRSAAVASSHNARDPRIEDWEADFISSADVEPGLRTAEGGKVNSLPRVFMIGRLLPAVAALLVFCSICGPYAAIAQEHPAHEWGYSGSEGCCLTNYLAHF